jgi:PAS domain S-box-containing protein
MKRAAWAPGEGAEDLPLILALVDSAPIAIYHADRAGHLTYANPQYRAMFHLGPEQSLDDWAQAMHPDDAPRIEALWQEFFRSDSNSMHFEYSARALAGGWRHLCEHVVVIGAQRERGFVGTISDVSDLKIAHAQLEKLHRTAESASRAKSEFLANMSHEIRTPLNGVIGITRLLLDTALSADQRELVAIARSSGQSLLAVLNDVLDFSKIEANRMTLERTDLDLREIIDQSVDTIALQAAEKGLTLIVDVDPSLPLRLCGDPTRLRQIILNLLTNAVKFTDRGEVCIGARVLTVAPAGVGLRVEVVDTGVGLSAEQSAKLFTAFVQADSSTTRRFGGSGLGLSICRRLIELMGGSIGVDSRVGHGSCFWFELTLPVAEQPSSARPAQELNGCSVLLVDAHPASLRILAAQLAAIGCRVTCASMALEAEAAWNTLLASGQVPDVVILDHALPDHPGTWVGDRVRRHPAGARVPIVLMTPLSAKPREAVDGYLINRAIIKPVKASALEHCLSELVGRRHPKPALDAVSTASLRGLRVLIAEDNVVNQMIGRKTLEKMGASVVVVENGRAAIDHLASADAHVVLMDCQMPGLDGYEATRMIRAGAAGAKARSMPVIALTAHASTDERVRCLAAGMDDHLTKPIDVSALRALLEPLVPAADD